VCVCLLRLTIGVMLLATESNDVFVIVSQYPTRPVYVSALLSDTLVLFIATLCLLVNSCSVFKDAFRLRSASFVVRLLLIRCCFPIQHIS